MPRSDQKAANIAYNIIGRPSNLLNQRDKKSKDIVNKPLVAKRSGYSELERSTPVRIPSR